MAGYDPDDILFPTEGIFDPPAKTDNGPTEAQQNELDALSSAYRHLFTGTGSHVDADKVVKDLYRVCWGAVTTFDPDPRVHAYREGARSVLLHILKYAGYNAAATRKDRL